MQKLPFSLKSAFFGGYSPESSSVANVYQLLYPHHPDRDHRLSTPPTPLVMNNLDRMVRAMLIGAGVLGVGVFLLFQF